MKLYGIGVGPGDPELITLKTHKILKKADMIIAPKSGEKKGSLAFSIIKGIIGRRKNKPIVVEPLFPMIRDEEGLEVYLEKAALEVLERRKECKTIAFITLGDPGLYSTFYRFLGKIQNLTTRKIEVEVVPGITSISACSAASKVPIAEGDEIVIILPNAKPEKMREVIKNSDTIILMKPKDMVVKELFGEETNREAILGIKVGMHNQKIILGTVNEIPKIDEYLSICIIRGG